MGRGRADRLEAKLRALSNADLDTAEGKALLMGALADPSSHVVAKAARIVGEQEWWDAHEALVAAFDHAMEQPVKRDPGCKVKAAVVRALIDTRYPHPDVFLRGVHLRQPEPAWPKPIDTASGVRSQSAFGLVAVGWPDTPVALADLLHDPEVPCRASAARALAAWGDPVVAAALVHLRLGAGEPEPDVISECLDALLALDAEAALPWVVAHLFGDDEMLAECAAISLGSSRREEALVPLQEWVQQRPQPQLRRVGLVAMGLVRSEASIALLLEWLAQGGPKDAEAALEGLLVHAHDPRVVEKVREVALEAGRLTLLGHEWGQG